MLERIVELSIRQRFAVLAAVFIFAAVGIYSFGRLKIDAVPDITNVQVQINTSAPGFSPLEAEQRITYPVETAIAGLPGLSYTRSVSRYGLSQVTVVFEDGTDIYFARHLVNERLPALRVARLRCRRGTAAGPRGPRHVLRPAAGEAVLVALTRGARVRPLAASDRAARPLGLELCGAAILHRLPLQGRLLKDPLHRVGLLLHGSSRETSCELTHGLLVLCAFGLDRISLRD